MKKHLNFWVIAIFGMLTVGFTSCGEEEGLKHSPEYNMITSVPNHAVIFSYDMMGMMDKSKVRSSEDMPFELKMMMNLYFDKMFSNKSTGLQLEGNNHIVITSKEDGQMDFGFVTLNVLDESKIKKGLKEFLKGETVEEEGIKYLTDKYSGAVAAWDTVNFVLAFAEEENVDLKGKTKSILGARYIDGPDNPNLESYLNRKDDMNMFVYLDQWAKMADASEEEYKMDAEIMKLYESGYMTGSGNFEAGSIVFEMEVHADKLKNSEYNILSKGPVSDDFMNYLTDNQLVMFGAANIDVKAFFDVVFQDEKMKDDFNNEMKDSGLDEATIKTLFTGEMVASLIDIEMMENPYYEESMKTLEDDFFADMDFGYVPKTIPMPRVLTTFGISDAAKMEAIVQLIPDCQKVNNYYKLGNDGFIVVHEDKLFITSHEDIATMLANGEHFKPYQWDGKIESPLYGYINSNRENLPKGFVQMMKEGEESGDEFLKFFDEFESVNFMGGFDHMKFEVIMKNKETNSLEIITAKMMNQVIENAEMLF